MSVNCLSKRSVVEETLHSSELVVVVGVVVSAKQHHIILNDLGVKAFVTEEPSERVNEVRVVSIVVGKTVKEHHDEDST